MIMWIAAPAKISINNTITQFIGCFAISQLISCIFVPYAAAEVCLAT
jgi:hypothetical protein